MYESFFGLRKRPFAAAPDAAVLVETPAVTEAVARLDRCVRQGGGVAVLTGAAGMGKTHLCHRLASEWSQDFKTVVLPNAGFPTRRGLLQSVLAELDEPYQRLAEAELRLRLTSVARTLRSQGTSVVLLFDEAHRHTERILEEIRLIANLVDGGEPLFRIVLAGQVELEERLAEPTLAGVNERVGELVTLPRLTAEEARLYLRGRVEFAGGDLADLFEPAAVELLVQACGGVPRCLNQLADHGLLLGYVAERRPVGESLVREALDDLKRLPLHWHDPLPLAQERASFESSSNTESAVSTSFNAVIEVGGLDDADPAEQEIAALEFDDKTSAALPRASFAAEGMPLAEPGDTAVANAMQVAPSPSACETIRDRYARLDAMDAHRRWVESVEREESGSTTTSWTGSGSKGGTLSVASPANPLEVLDRIEPLIAEALAVGGCRRESAQEAPAEGFTSVETVRMSPCSAAAVASPRTEMRHSTLFSDLRRRRKEGLRGDR